MLVAGPISAVLAQPGLQGRITLPKIGDTEVTVTVTEKRHDKRIIKLRTTASSQRGEMVIDGTAMVKKVPLGK
jgi:3-hydroxybutyryl-CoA dehydratase